MRMAPPQHRAYSYRVTVPPVKKPVQLTTFKAHIKKTNSSEDALLCVYLDAAVGYAEKLMRRDLITRTYETFRDFFPQPWQNEGYYHWGIVPSKATITTSVGENTGFEIRKSPLQSVESIEYLVDNVLTAVSSSVYYNTVEDDYSEILSLPGQDWPDNADRRMQTVKITFKAGFGDSETDIPNDIRTAILGHATALWKNRGDCGSDACAATVPAASKAIYLQNRIENL